MLGHCRSWQVSRLLACVAMMLAGLATCRADSPNLPPAQRAALEQASRFGMIHSVAALPRGVLDLCADEQHRLAEPGQPWAATDLVRDAALPRKRLIWAASDGLRYVVHYEAGGRGHSFHVLLATLSPGESGAREIWRAIGYPLRDYADFLDALHSHRLDDSPRIAH
jgi:hypothetical protein